jgi:RNA polymerase sigma-70 factor (ECF subfamily)
MQKRAGCRVIPMMLGLRAGRHNVRIRTLQAELKRGLLDELAETSPGLRGRGDLDAACASVVGAIAWPPEWLEAGSFGGYLARRIDPGVDVVAALAELCVSDLYLAASVVAGVPAALAAFDRMLTTDLPPAIRSIDTNRDTIDEVLQQLREKLLVPHEGGVRLESYSGHGPLGAWLRVSALRVALSLKRKIQPEQTPDEELAEILDQSANAEVKVLAQQLGADLRGALRAAIAAQPARTRAILRMYYADGRGVEDIGRVYNVHASSVSRWLAKARADILARTRAELTARLGTPASQLDSLLGHVASLEISFESLLRSTG